MMRNIILLCLTILSVGCSSGDSGGDSTQKSTNEGWVKIEYPTDQDTYTVNGRYNLYLSGSAFVSPDAPVCCDPGITVDITNASNNIQQTATIQPEICWFLQYYTCGASWYTSIPLSYGDNTITVHAYDSGGHEGTDILIVTVIDTILPSVTSIVPSDGSIDIPRDTSIQISFSEPIDISSMTPSRIYLMDQSSNLVPTTLNVNPTSATLIPDSLLDYSQQYTVYVEPGLVDSGGNTSDQLFTSSFTITHTPWNNPVANPVSGNRHHHTSIWTGSDIILWGGYYSDPDVPLNKGTINTGTRYNPVTEIYNPVTTLNAPIARALHTAIWTGSEMIIWGGLHGTYAGGYVESLENSGGRYDPLTDSWQATSLDNAPGARHSHTAVWTGSEMIIWGGTDLSLNRFNTGARYNPATDTWVALSTTNAPTGRFQHSAIWTGTEMIIWGGRDANGPTNTGARYNPTTDTWSPLSLVNAPPPRGKHTAVWTGSEILVWGKSQYTSSYAAAGGRYNPASDSWSSMSSDNSPVGREDHTATWNGTAMMIWGGFRVDDVYDPDLGFYRSSMQYLNDLTLYYPASDTWQPFPTANTPGGRYAHTANLSGSTLVICNGNEDATPDDAFTNDGRVTNSCVSLPAD